jgi:hypothetical protein
MPGCADLLKDLDAGSVVQIFVGSLQKGIR